MKLKLNNNTIPRPLTHVIDLANVSLTGAQTHGAAIRLEQNTAPRIAADVFDLIGDPAAPTIPGKQSLYAAAAAAVSGAAQAKGATAIAAREFCRLAINLLKPTLGANWNARWQAAGFLVPSLEVPRDNPGPMLDSLRGFFAANSEAENAQANVTAARARLLKTALYNAHNALADAETNRIDRKAARDVAFEKLRDRLTGLRNELEQLLEDHDGVWYKFGFRRPADAKMPALVKGLALTRLNAGTVHVTWSPSSLADSYRVSWRLAVPPSGAQPTPVGLFTDRACTISNLPSGTNIAVAVSARNDAGETQPTEAAILVP